MTFRQFAFNNVFRNKRLYAAYFLSSAFAVMVFFVYAVFAFHPKLTTVAIGGHVSKGLHFAEAIIYVFSFFFVLYSMGSFLKSRKKELGLLIMHGMTNMQLRTMIFLENMVIGLFATLFGIGTGLVFSKMMLLAAENILGLNKMLPFYFPMKALILTIAAFLLLFAAISFFTVAALRGNKLIDLIKGSAKPKPEPKVSRFLAILAAVLLAAGYGIALVVRGAMVSMALIPVALLVIIGTYFFFTQLSMWVIKALKGNRNFLFHKTNLLLFSDLAYRIKDNARTFFIVAIVSTVAFSAIGSLVGFKTVMTDLTIYENPFAVQYSSFDKNKKQAQQLALIQDVLDDADIPYKQYEATGLYQTIGEESPAMMIKRSDYNAIAKALGDKQVDIEGNEAVKVEHLDVLGEKRAEEHSTKPITLMEGDQSIQPVQTVQSNALPMYSAYYVISNELFQKLTKYEDKQQFFLFELQDGEEAIEAGAKLAKEMPASFYGGEYRFFALAHELNKLTQGYGAILFVGLFIGAVFFVAAGSFLYFRLYTDLEEDKRKFAAITKLGLTDKELSKVMTIQIALLFFIPIGVALIHGAVALTALQHMFNYSLVKESALVLGSFFLIQVVYFFIIRTTYIKNIKASIS